MIAKDEGIHPIAGYYADGTGVLLRSAITAYTTQLKSPPISGYRLIAGDVYCPYQLNPLIP